MALRSVLPFVPQLKYIFGRLRASELVQLFGTVLLMLKNVYE